MKGSALHFLLSALAALALVAGVSAALRADRKQRNYEIFTEMAYSKAAESYAPNRFFADGRTQQSLVPGVVPRGAEIFPYGAGPEEAQRAGRELKNPIALDDPAIAAQGASLYRMGCVVCHDARGAGRGAAVLRGMIPPPSLHGGRAKEIPDGEMFHILTRGQGNMASYDAEFNERERWLLVSFVRRLQKEGP